MKKRNKTKDARKLKQIPIWKITVYTVITLGWYSVLWPVRRRTEIVNEYKLAIPHNTWYLIAALIFYSAYIGFLVSIMHADIESTWPAWAFLLLPAASISLGVGIWWMLHFARAVAHITKGKMPVGWSLALFIIGTPFLSPILQFYINRVKQSEAASKEFGEKPSKKFIVTVSFLLVISLAYIAWDTNDTVRYIQERNRAQQYFREAGSLLEEYDLCISNLDSDSPEVTKQNEAAYNKAYESCNQIFVKQSEAVNNYNEIEY